MGEKCPEAWVLTAGEQGHLTSSSVTLHLHWTQGLTRVASPTTA